MTTREALTAAIASLLDRSGIAGDDDPLAARTKLLRLLEAENCHGEAHSPEDCPLGVWFRRETGLRILLTSSRSSSRVVATGGRVMGVLERCVMDLPTCVADAVREVDAERVQWLLSAKEAA